MMYPPAYLQYLVHFHVDRDYFECHEVLEEHWKNTKGSSLDEAWIALIQLAVALYHERRGNRKGARKLLENSLSHLNKEDMEKLGVDFEKLVSLLSDRLAQLEQEPPVPFRDINFPFHDRELLASLLALHGNRWGRKSPLDDDSLVHKHLYRDRSAVIQSRAQSLLNRKK